MTKELHAISEFDNANHQVDALADGLAGISKSVLENPVLPSEFALFGPAFAVNENHKFANTNRVPFAKQEKL